MITGGRRTEEWAPSAGGQTCDGTIGTRATGNLSEPRQLVNYAAVGVMDGGQDSGADGAALAVAAPKGDSTKPATAKVQVAQREGGAVARATALLDEMPLGAHQPRPAAREARLRARSEGRAAQLERMRVYGAAAACAGCVVPDERRQRRGSAVRFDVVAGAPERRLQRNERSGVVVASADSSAFAWCTSPASAPLLSGCSSPTSVTNLKLDDERSVESEPTARGLVLGSADPHELRLDDDRVARSRKRPTFSLQAHEPATAEELSARPIVRFNVAPSTDPVAAPMPQPEGAPVVRSLADLLKPSWLQRVRRWERRARRAMRLARRGDSHRAKRMRPPDLWVSAEDSMLPSVAAWDWDLTPWARGEPALPTVPSGAGGVEPRTSLNLQAVREAATAGDSFADKGIVDEMLNGITDDVEAPRGTFLCAPHAGALRYHEQVRDRLQAGVDEGWTRSFSSVPYWPIRCDPYSIVDESERAGKPKFRFLNDHSWGDDGRVQSLNSAMDRSQWPAAKMVRVSEVAEAAAVLKQSGAPVKVGVLDCVAYYKTMGRQLAELARNGVITEDAYLVDDRCCFGSAADAAKCVRVSNFLVHHARQAMQKVDAMFPSRDERVLAWLEQRRTAALRAGASDAEMSESFATLFTVSQYIDDGSHVSIDDLIFDANGNPVLRGGVHLRRAQLHWEAYIDTLHRFGFKSEQRKEQPPRTRVVLLGVCVDIDLERFWLDEPKRVKYAARSRRVASERTCEREEFMSLLGKLNFAAICYPRGRQWLHAPWRAARASFRTRADRVIISSSVSKALVRWAIELENAAHPGVPLASSGAFPESTSAEALAIYADAARESSGGGFGAWTVVDDELLYVEGEWSAEERRELLICDLELAASTIGLVALQPLSRRKHVYSFTDNTVAMAAMRGLTPSTAPMQELTEARVGWLLAGGVAEAAERITSKSNLWADLLSRSRLADVLQQAEGLGLRTRRVEPPATWRSMVTAMAARARGERLRAPSAFGDRPQTASLPSALLTPCRSRGECSSGGGAAVAGGEGGAQEALPRCGGSGPQWRPTDDGCPVVAQVRCAGQIPLSLHPPDGAVEPRGQTRGGAATHGLCAVASAMQAVGTPHLGAYDQEVHQPGESMAPSPVQNSPLRRLGLLGDQRPHERRVPADRATVKAGQVWRAHAAPQRGYQTPPEQSVGRRCQLGGSAVRGLLRAHARGGVLPAARGDVQPAAQSDACRRVLPPNNGGAKVCGYQYATGEAEAGARQGRAASISRRRDAPRPSGDARAPVGARPRAGGSACQNAPLQDSEERRNAGRTGPRDGQVVDEHDRLGPGKVWCAQPPHRRCYSGAGGQAFGAHATCSGTLARRRHEPVHAREQGGDDEHRDNRRVDRV